MAVSNRIYGNTGFIFSLKKGSASAVLFDDVKSFELTNEPKDDSDLTFSEAASGLGVNWTLSVTAVASTDSGSLHAYLWDNAGSDVTVVLAPHGNATPSSTKPHFTLTAKIPSKPGLSNEASTGTSGASFDFELRGTSDVTKVTA